MIKIKAAVVSSGVPGLKDKGSNLSFAAPRQGGDGQASESKFQVLRASLAGNNN